MVVTEVVDGFRGRNRGIKNSPGAVVLRSDAAGAPLQLPPEMPRAAAPPVYMHPAKQSLKIACTSL